MKCILLVSLFLQLLTSLTAGERQELLQTLDKINAVQRTFIQEKQSWQEEKETLQLQLQLIEDSVKNSTQNQVEIRRQIAELKKRQESLKLQASKLSESEVALKKILKTQLKSLHEKVKRTLPFSLQQLILEEAQDLEDALLDNKIDLLSHLPVSRDYFNAVFDLQKNTHLVKEVIELPSGKQQVTVIYIGIFKGFYLTKDEKSAGELIFSQGQWQAQVNDGLLIQIKKALMQFNREGKPELVNLPVLGEAK